MPEGVALEVRCSDGTAERYPLEILLWIPNHQVTGCSSGLGQALATCLHSQTTPDGRTLYKVYATARRLKTLEPLADLGISTLALDVGSEASVKEAVATVLSREERLDVLVNNAGISKFGPLAEQPLSEVTAVFDTNVMGVLRMTQVGWLG